MEVLADLDPQTWGNAAEWAAAVGTTAAFIVALRLLLHERDARQDAEADERRSQARLVSAWTVGVFSSSERDEYGNPDPFVVDVVCRNNSEEPIYDVMAWVRHSAKADADATPGYLGLVAPGDTRGIQLIDVPLVAGVLPPTPVEVTFTDAQGRQWHRGEGTLRSLDENPDDAPWRRLHRLDPPPAPERRHDEDET